MFTNRNQVCVTYFLTTNEFVVNANFQKINTISFDFICPVVVDMV